MNLFYLWCLTIFALLLFIGGATLTLHALTQLLRPRTISHNPSHRISPRPAHIPVR